VDAWVAAFRYAGAAREVVARVKYRDARAAVPWLARQMARAWQAADLAPGVVTWAPTTPEHRRTRGFDPAELLARGTARQLRVPVRRLLVRRPGPPQTGLSARARAAGPRFDARPPVPPTVLVVDDVATTGATLASAAGALRAAGAARVLALTAARTPHPGDGA
jgi:predicted amidophosphoribosyltransferase